MGEAIELAEVVRLNRLNLGLNHYELAALLGLYEEGDNIVRRWESGLNTPSIAQIEAIGSLQDSIPFRSPYVESTAEPKFRFIDLFAGIGGIRLPFQELGGHGVFASEWDKFSQKTYSANFGEVPNGDITQIRASSIPNHDVLLAGFPCQAFSQAGLRQGFADTRGTMFFEIQRILAYHRPKAFLLENVKQLRGHEKGRTLATILSILRGDDIPSIPDTIPIGADARASLTTRLNYRVAYDVLSAKDFGVPQNRERVYIIGFDRDKVPAAEERDISREILDRLLLSETKTRLGSVLEPNISVPSKYTISDRLLAGHERRLQEHRAKGNGFGFSLFNEESPYCNTISARYYKDGSEILIDQSDIFKNPRKLTPRECARIQGFPENFKIDAVSDVQIYKQFGNSVSMPVIKAIASEMVPFLNK